MHNSKAKEARSFFIVTILLLIAGIFIFISASFGVLIRRPEGVGSLILRQFGLGLGVGFILLFLCARIDLRLWKRYSPYLFLFSIFLTLAVFIPSIGFEHGGARRWISIAGISLQPSELLKFAFILYLASWFSSKKEDEIASAQKGLLPFLAVLALAGGVLISQPDIGTFGVIALTGAGMFFLAGARLKHIILMLALGLALVWGLSILKPYAMARLTAFLNPSYDPQGIGYQIKQSLIAVGSGGLSGRGFGQSIQKFKYLPEPVGDSIFAVFAEEFGFMGSAFLIALYILFLSYGFKIALSTGDKFTGLAVAGIVILIVSQSFINIGSMIRLSPLTGMPLVFISQGGSALAITLAEIGFILNAAKKMFSA